MSHGVVCAINTARGPYGDGEDAGTAGWSKTPNEGVQPAHRGWQIDGGLAHDAVSLCLVCTLVERHGSAPG